MSDQIVVLTVQSMNASGEKVFRLHKKRAVLGSATSSDLQLEDASISPVHAILEVSGVDGKPVIYDLASDTGIIVNGHRTVQATLNPSDKIQIGPYLIGVRLQRLSEVPRAPEFTREAVGGQTLFVNEKEDLAPLLLEDESSVIDIFDHRPESKLSLQMVMFHDDMILDVEHFVNRKRVVIGPGTKEDFSIPPFLGKGKQGRFDIITNENGQYYLHLHDSMNGVVSQNGNVMPVKEVMAAMVAGGNKIYPLGQKDFAKVSLGDVSFFMNFTPAPPRLKLPRLFESDPGFFRIWALSFISVIAVFAGMSFLHVNPAIEIEQLPERTATVLLDPKMIPPMPKPKPKPEPTKEPEKVVEKKVEPPKPKPKPTKVVINVTDVKPKTEAPKNPVIAPKPEKTQKAVPAVAHQQKANKVTQASTGSGNGGAGARAAGEKGQSGEKNAPKKNYHAYKADRPSPGNPKRAATGMGGVSEKPDLGVVDMFKEMKGTLKNVTASGTGAGNSADRLRGYGGFTTQGNGGLAEAGSGAGGGGKSQGLGGLSDHGIGGGSHGTGLGQIGSGGNMFGGSGKLPISAGGSPEPIVIGGIDTDAIARAIAAHRDEIKYCYEKEINADHPDMAGRVGVRFTIGASGTVSAAGVANTTLHNGNTERCVVEVIRRIAFPPVRGGGIAEVTYPFVFKPSNK